MVHPIWHKTHFSDKWAHVSLVMPWCIGECNSSRTCPFVGSGARKTWALDILARKPGSNVCFSRSCLLFDGAAFFRALNIVAPLRAMLDLPKILCFRFRQTRKNPPHLRAFLPPEIWKDLFDVSQGVARFLNQKKRLCQSPNSEGVAAQCRFHPLELLLRSKTFTYEKNDNVSLSPEET